MSSEEYSEHQGLVEQIRGKLHELGLMTWRKSGVFSQGFIPDILTNVGGTQHDWVIIEVINTQESLVRDIGGLLVVLANIEKTGQSVRRIIVATSRHVEDVSVVSALTEKEDKFRFTYSPTDASGDVEILLRHLMVEASRDTLAKMSEHQIDMLFEWLIACEDQTHYKDYVKAQEVGKLE